MRALLCVAPTDDVRHYLRGIHLDAKNCIATATDGHRLLQVPFVITENPMKIDNVILSLPTSKPRKSHLSVIVEVGRNPNMPEEVTWTYTARARRKQVQQLSNLVDGTYPNIDNVKPKEFTGVNPFAFNPKYVSDVPAELGSSCVQLFPSSNLGLVQVKLGVPDEEGVFYGIMPMRP